MKLIVIDVDNIAHRAWHVIKRKNNVIYHVLQSLQFLQDVLGINQVAYCFDSRESRRREVCAEYKANRTTEGKDDLYDQLNNLRTSILANCGFRNIFHHEGYEADDLIAAICKHAFPDDEIVIVSTDTDLWQLLSDKVTIWNPATKATITAKWFEAEHGFKPSRWIECKAIIGDTADNLKGVQGVGEVNSIRWMLDLLTPDSKAHKQIEASRLIIERNKLLMTLPWPGVMVPLIQDNLVTPRKWDAVARAYGVPLQFRPN